VYVLVTGWNSAEPVCVMMGGVMIFVTALISNYIIKLLPIIITDCIIMWLNEGFASYVEWIGTVKSEPQWNYVSFLVVLY
jgi:hypothetical protein